MSTIEVRGLFPIKGEIEVQGSKNAVLPVMAASILNHGITVIDNVPGIQDVFCMMGILNSLGCGCELTGRRLKIDAGHLSETTVKKEDMGRMRSSIMLLGALLGRTGEATVYCPGGCMIGKRPIDLHLMALERMGVIVKQEADAERLTACASSLRGASVSFPFPSVGATENAIFAAVAAEGHTHLNGCAKEPEIIELCHFLINMGASIRGVGTDHLSIEGRLPLHDSHYTIGGDRIVAGTYLAAAAGAMGEVLLTGIRPSELTDVTSSLRAMGAEVFEEEELLYLKITKQLKGISVKTGPYPGFPTDLQSMMMVMLSLSDNGGMIEETIFENRFKTAGELIKLGAGIEIHKDKAHISGNRKLRGAIVEAGDLRGGAALVCAGLSAEGNTRITGCEHIYRGYEDICRDLRGLGADIRYRANETL